MMGQIRVTGDLLGNLNLEIERKFDILYMGVGHIWLARFYPACIMDIN